jgi:hypothetical protein
LIIVWGFSSDDKLLESKQIGRDVLEVKQVFSALLFKSGVQGIIVRIESVIEKSEATIQLLIDDEPCLSDTLSLEKPGDYTSEMKDLKIPNTKIEIVFKIIKGCVGLPTSSIGNGMGFQKIAGKYQPTKHLGLGLII